MGYSQMKSLLSKKGWTGIEVGKLTIASLVHEMKNKGIEHKPLLTQEEVNRITNSLEGNENWRQYGVYYAIYSSLIETHNLAQAYIQQFNHGYFRYYTYIKEAFEADKTLARLYDHPLVLTQNRYDALKAQAEEKLRSYTESYVGAVFFLTSHFAKNIDEAPADIKKAIEATKKEAVTNQRILDNYCIDKELGYYEYEDGTRSDQLSPEDAKEKYEADLMKGSEDLTEEQRESKRIGWLKLFYEGADSVKEAYEKLTGERITDAEALDMYYCLQDMLEGTDNYESEDYSKLSTLLGAKSSKAWHFYTELPEDITKNTVLTHYIGRYEGDYSLRYCAEQDKDLKEISREEQFKEFTEDYPEVYKAVSAYLEKKVPAFKGIKKAKQFDSITTCGELADLSLQAYIDFTTPSDDEICDELEDNYTKRKRAFGKGIAIIQNPKALDIDEDGYFKDGDDIYFTLGSLDRIDRLSEINGSPSEYRDTTALPSLKFLYAYNVLLDIIAKAYCIDDMDYFKANTAHYEENISGVNDLIYAFYCDVCGNADEKERKRKLIKEYFEPVDTEELKPSPEAIAEVTETINRLGFSEEAKPTLKIFSKFINVLMEK